MKFFSILSILHLTNADCIGPAINNLAQDDPKLVKFIKQNLLQPPPLVPNSISEMVRQSYRVELTELTTGIPGNEFVFPGKFPTIFV